MEQLRKLNRILKALSDEGRLRIVFLLNKKKGLCVNEIREIIDLSQPTISSHLKVLENAGLIVNKRDGIWVNYSLNPEMGPRVERILKDSFYLMESSRKVKEDIKKLGTTDRKLICKGA